jgi:hypothetical protein
MFWLGNSNIRVGVCLLVLCRHRHLFRIEFAELGGVFIKDGEAIVRRWYYYRGRYWKATKVKERAGRRLVLRQIATLGSHLVQTIDIHAAKSLLA